MAIAYTLLHQEHEGSVTVASAAGNRWAFRRVDGRWLVHERTRRQVGTDGFAQVVVNPAHPTDPAEPVDGAHPAGRFSRPADG